MASTSVESFKEILFPTMFTTNTSVIMQIIDFMFYSSNNESAVHQQPVETLPCNHKWPICIYFEWCEDLTAHLLQKHSNYITDFLITY